MKKMWSNVSVSLDEICKYLGIGKDTVYKWFDKYDMPAHRMGRLWQILIAFKSAVQKQTGQECKTVV